MQFMVKQAPAVIITFFKDRDNLTECNFPYTVLNGRKHLQSFHSFMVNVLI